MRGKRSQRFGSERRNSAIAPIVGTLILIVVVVTAVGSFAYVLTAFQSQNENSQDKLSASQNDNLQISLVQLSPADPETQFQFNYNGGILYVHYVSDTSIAVYDFGGRAFPGTLVTLDHSYARIEGGLQAYIDLVDMQAQLTFSTSQPSNPNFVPITFQVATWNSMTLTVLNENTQGSGVSAISVNDMGISSFEQVDLSSGSLVATFFPGQVPLNLPGRGIATLEVNVQKLNLLKNSTLSVNVLSTHDNVISDVLSPPSSTVSVSMLDQYLGPTLDSQTMDTLDGSRSLSTNNSIVDYMWRIDVPYLSSWNGKWNDYDNIRTVFTQGKSIEYTPGTYFASNVLPFLNNSELRATLTVVDSTGLMSSSTQVLNPQTQQSVASQGNSHYPLPRSPPPAKHLYVTTDSSWGYTLTALEGLVARQSPQIFFQQNQMDATYLNEIKAEFGISSEVDTAQQIMQRFVTPQYVSQTNGMFNVVVFDDNEPASDYYWETNTARAIAGVTGALPVGSSQLSLFQTWFPNTNVLYDLTNPNICGGCAETSAGAVNGYTWAWTTFGPQTTRQFQTMSPNGRFMGGDYEVEFKSFVWSMCNPSVATGCIYDVTQSNLANTILSAYPAGSVSMGFFGLNGETQTITTLSSLGILQDNSELATDLSLYSGLPSLTNINFPPVRHLTYDNTKNYVLWEYSQGDADTYEFYAIQSIYQQVDPVTGNYFRDEIPVTIQLKTMMAQTAPPVLQLYYADQNSLADFMTSPSGGAGYGHPDQMTGGTLTGSENWYAQLSNSLAQNVGVKDVFIIWSGSFSLSDIQTYIQDWGPPAPYALFFWQQGGTTLPAIVNGVPVFTTSLWVPNWGNGWTTQDVSDTVQCIQGTQPAGWTGPVNDGHGPCSGGQFVNALMNTQLPGYDFIQQVMNSLGPNYIAVNSEQYACLYLQSQGLSC